MNVQRQEEIIYRVFDALEGVEQLTDTEAAAVIANLANNISGHAPGKGLQILAKAAIGIARVENMHIPTSLCGWIPVKSLLEVPSDGTYVDLWVLRGDGDIHDCYFPKCYRAEGGWVTEDGETEIGHADFYRVIAAPAVFNGGGA